MIEILIVWKLCKKIGGVIRNKSRKPLPYQFMLVTFWIGGEIAGGVAAMVYTQIRSGVLSDDVPASAYLFALLGAAMGACLAFAIAHIVPDESHSDERSGAFDCPNCGEPNNDPTISCGVCGHNAGMFDARPT